MMIQKSIEIRDQSEKRYFFIFSREINYYNRHPIFAEKSSWKEFSVASMIPGNLENLLKSRRQYIDEVSDVVVGQGSSSSSCAESGSTPSRLGSMSFVDKTTSGFTGLVNQGATCYLNSLVQSLFMLSKFRQAVYDHSYDASSDLSTDENCLTRQLQKLFVMLQYSQRSAVSTSALTKSFGWTSQDNFTQQDVNECMTVIFDFLISQNAGTPLGHFLTSRYYFVSILSLSWGSCHLPYVLT
jgi:hypothetical protein